MYPLNLTPLLFLVFFSSLTSRLKLKLYIANENLLRVSYILMSLDFSGLP